MAWCRGQKGATAPRTVFLWVDVCPLRYSGRCAVRHSGGGGGGAAGRRDNAPPSARPPLGACPTPMEVAPASAMPQRAASRSSVPVDALWWWWGEGGSCCVRLHAGPCSPAACPRPRCVPRLCAQRVLLSLELQPPLRPRSVIIKGFGIPDLTKTKRPFSSPQYFLECAIGVPLPPPPVRRPRGR